MFTGTVGQTEVIGRHYPKKQALPEVDIQDDSISQIVTAWSGQSVEGIGKRTFKQDVLETEFVQAAGIVHKKGWYLFWNSNGKPVLQFSVLPSDYGSP